MPFPNAPDSADNVSLLTQQGLPSFSNSIAGRFDPNASGSIAQRFAPTNFGSIASRFAPTNFGSIASRFGPDAGFQRDPMFTQRDPIFSPLRSPFFSSRAYQRQFGLPRYNPPAFGDDDNGS